MELAGSRRRLRNQAPQLLEVDATEGWEYYIGVLYVLFIVLVIWRAYTWPKEGQA
jgi:hypothetical protein